MMNKEMKSERITLRVSPKEKEEIEKKAAQAHLPVSKYLVRVAEFDDPKKFKEDVLVNICASIFYPAQDLQKIIDGINSDNCTIQRKLYEIDDLLRELLKNTVRLAEFLDNQKKSEPESDQYKRINKQLDKLIALMSENE